MSCPTGVPGVVQRTELLIRELVNGGRKKRVGKNANERRVRVSRLADGSALYKRKRYLNEDWVLSKKNRSIGRITIVTTEFCKVTNRRPCSVIFIVLQQYSRFVPFLFLLFVLFSYLRFQCCTRHRALARVSSLLFSPHDASVYESSRNTSLDPDSCRHIEGVYPEERVTILEGFTDTINNNIPSFCPSSIIIVVK